MYVSEYLGQEPTLRVNENLVYQLSGYTVDIDKCGSFISREKYRGRDTSILSDSPIKIDPSAPPASVQKWCVNIVREMVS